MKFDVERPSLDNLILDHTEARLLAQGYRAMRVDEIARDAGISKRTLYERFRSKEEMARSALERRFDLLVAELERRIASSLDELAQLREAVVLVCESEASLSLAFRRELERTPGLAAIVEAGRLRTFAKIEAVIEAGCSRGRLRQGVDPRQVRRALLAAVAATCQPAALAEDDQTPTRTASATLGLLLEGLVPR